MNSNRHGDLLESLPKTACVQDVDELLAYYPCASEGLRANMIFSADGAAAIDGSVQRLTCDADQILLRHLRSHADVILVGAATARAEGYGPVRLADEQRQSRNADGHHREPRIAVVSQTGNIPPSLFDDSFPMPLLITSESAAEHNRLVTNGDREVLIAGTDSVDIVSAVGALRGLGLGRILCEGGPTLLDEVIRAELLDEICVTLAPRLAGSQSVGIAPAIPLESPLSLELLHTLAYDDYVFLRYRRAASTDLVDV